MGRDLYTVLGVDADASAAQLRAAYHQLARRWHPDRCPDPDAPRRFAEIADAYRVLSDPDMRAEYDRSRPLLRPGALMRESAHVTADDLLGVLFTGPQRKHRRRRRRWWRRAADVTADTESEAEDGR